MYKKIATSIVKERFTELQERMQGIIGIDTIQVDVPLMIRLLEYAREEVKSDSDLHVLVAKLVELSEYGDVLDMADYDDIVGVERE